MQVGDTNWAYFVEHFDIKSRISIIHPMFFFKDIEPLHIIPYPLPGGFLELQYILWGNLGHFGEAIELCESQ